MATFLVGLEFTVPDTSAIVTLSRASHAALSLPVASKDLCLRDYRELSRSSPS